ncbi:MAG TPA: DUF1848 domain-containing protein [Desulfomonilaceae bacterium]|nr:DUF1848 domain-containing protein [Desulfomonilaceae bacterium]
MNLISASRRTDIPAFHAEWFMKRIRSGSVGVVSPFGGKRFEVSLEPADVIAIVFWTKNASPLLTYVDELKQRGYCFTFLYTINNYPAWVEPRVPDLCQTIRVLEDLTFRFGAPVVRWRYDTVILTDTLNRDWHVRNFHSLCAKLSPFVNECIFSFCDYYKKTSRNMERTVPDHHKPDDVEYREIAGDLARVAQSFGISLASCAHDFLLSDAVSKARCMDPNFLSRAVDSAEKRRALARLKTAATRKECACVASRDIGAYDTCAHGCIYCYANTNPALATRNLKAMDSDSHYLDPKGSTGRVF